MSTFDLYQQLLAEATRREAELENARVEFERSQEAARKAAEALRNAAQHLQPAGGASVTKPVPPATIAALREPVQPAVIGQPSFIDVVAESIEGIDTNITTALVFQKLSGTKVVLGDDPRTKISTALSRLEKRGTLVKVVEGGIGRAHVYERPAKKPMEGRRA
jgi:hypothetical protein